MQGDRFFRGADCEEALFADGIDSAVFVDAVREYRGEFQAIALLEEDSDAGSHYRLHRCYSPASRPF